MVKLEHAKSATEPTLTRIGIAETAVPTRGLYTFYLNYQPPRSMDMLDGNFTRHVTLNDEVDYRSECIVDVVPRVCIGARQADT